jgi:hypothetical protein
MGNPPEDPLKGTLSKKPLPPDAFHGTHSRGPLQETLLMGPPPRDNAREISPGYSLRDTIPGIPYRDTPQVVLLQKTPPLYPFQWNAFGVNLQRIPSWGPSSVERLQGTSPFDHSR